MNKFAPSLPAAGLACAFCVCLLALPVSAFTQGSGPSSKPAVVAPSVIPAANQVPGATNVETPADETKSDDANVPANDTEILATQGATFAAKTRIAVFSGDVRVRDTRFTLACDKLTVFLARGAAPAAAPTPAPTETPAKAADDKSGDSDRGGGIDRAVAEGHVIIIQKHAATKPGEEEKISVGRSDIAEFDNKTGDMTLRGMPKVEQNGNSHEALSRSTWMVLHKDNSLDTHGPSRTLIVPHGKDNLPGGSPATKPGSTLPSASPAGRKTPTGGTQS